MRRVVLRTSGIALLLSGLVVFPLPIPFGLLMIATGLVLLIGNSESASGVLQRARRRWRLLNHWLRRAGAVLPRRMHRILAATDPRRRPRGVRP